MQGITEKAVGTVIAYRRAGYGWLDWNGTQVWIHIQDVRDKQGHLLPAIPRNPHPHLKSGGPFNLT